MADGKYTCTAGRRQPHSSAVGSASTSAANATLLAFAAERPAAAPAAVDRRSLLPARRSAANPPHATTDGRTDIGPFHRPCSAYYASSVNDAEKCSFSHRRSGVMIIYFVNLITILFMSTTHLQTYLRQLPRSSVTTICSLSERRTRMQTEQLLYSEYERHSGTEETETNLVSAAAAVHCRCSGMAWIRPTKRL